MSWLRSWKLCEVRPRAHAGIAGWEKWRLRRAAVLIPPGNAFLLGMGAGCRMLGSGWLEHEKEVFGAVHPEFPPPRTIGGSTLWLPHLPGVELRRLPADRLERAARLAFAELGRFHRLRARSLHGDPHAGNFLYDAEEERCRIIDFETDVPPRMATAAGRASDFMILALDLWRQGGGSMADLGRWQDAYGIATINRRIEAAIRHPGFRMKAYWRWLGYRLPV